MVTDTADQRTPGLSQQWGKPGSNGFAHPQPPCGPWSPRPQAPQRVERQVALEPEGLPENLYEKQQDPPTLPCLTQRGLHHTHKQKAWGGLKDCSLYPQVQLSVGPKMQINEIEVYLPNDRNPRPFPLPGSENTANLAHRIITTSGKETYK